MFYKSGRKPGIFCRKLPFFLLKFGEPGPRGRSLYGKDNNRYNKNCQSKPPKHTPFCFGVFNSYLFFVLHIFSRTLSFALRDLGFLEISSQPGVRGFGVSILAPTALLKKSLTSPSSPE